MVSTQAAILLACLLIAGLKFIHAVMCWSFSTARRHRLEANARAKVARHRGGRWVA